MLASPGTRVLFVECSNCGHKRSMRPGEVPAGAPWGHLLERLRCTRCGQYQANIRFQWFYPAVRKGAEVVPMGTRKGRRATGA